MLMEAVRESGGFCCLKIRLQKNQNRKKQGGMHLSATTCFFQSTDLIFHQKTKCCHSRKTQIKVLASLVCNRASEDEFRVQSEYSTFSETNTALHCISIAISISICQEYLKFSQLIVTWR